MKILWLDEPEAHDYDAARDYLELTRDRTQAAYLADLLRDEGNVVVKKAKDIVRASGHWMLPKDFPSVKHDLKKIEKGKPLSPVLLVVESWNASVTIADGFHRVCAAYWWSENTEIPARIVWA